MSTRPIIVGTTLLFATPLISCALHNHTHTDQLRSAEDSCEPQPHGSEDNYACDENDQILVCDPQSQTWHPARGSVGYDRFSCSCNQGQAVCTTGPVGYAGITSIHRPQTTLTLRSGTRR